MAAKSISGNQRLHPGQHCNAPASTALNKHPVPQVVPPPPPFDDIEQLATGQHGDPFAVLGLHQQSTDQGQPPGSTSAVYRCFLPRTRQAWLNTRQQEMTRVPHSDLFEYHPDGTGLPDHPLIIRLDDNGHCHSAADPYSFPPLLDAAEMQLFQQGRHYRLQQLLGARPFEVHGIAGTLFSVWAPHARRVSVVGDFNGWDGRCHPMRKHPAYGVWELFIPAWLEGPYKFELRHAGADEVLLKADPLGRQAERRPATASLITATTQYHWQDHDWSTARRSSQALDQPISVYEVHLGSWRKNADGGFLSYTELASALCDHAGALGFTHLELLPMKEHPLDESWGYQSTGYFAPTSRHGQPDDFRAFVDHCHQRGIGVILDWVPAHFPRDAHALGRFDGEPLYEYPDPWKAEQRDWGTLVFNYERNEVRSFLISSALYWLEEFHLDGLRVDAVASMLYLNFSRQADQWVPNRLGGPHNLEAIEFIRELNQAVRQHCPGCLMIAEESTDWHGVTHPLETGGLGFDLKWNMGWMHDTLNYLSKDPIHRQHHHDWLTFGPSYAFNENFILPLSHDEVVHLKKSLFGRMPGDEWQRFANLRLLYTYQWTFPGKKLLFMGGEFAQATEWDSGSSLPWQRAEHPLAQGLANLLTMLNRLQGRHPALRGWDCDARGFEWLDGEDRQHSVLCFLRHGPQESLIVALNFTPQPRSGYRIPVHQAGTYRQIFSSDDASYGGSNMAQRPSLRSEAQPHCGRQHSLSLDLPPLAGVILQRLDEAE